MISQLTRSHAFLTPVLAVLSGLLLSTPSAIAQAPSTGPLKVFLLAGQSNMVGKGAVDEEVDGVQRVGTLRDVVAKNPTDYGHLIDGSSNWVLRDDAWIWSRAEDFTKQGDLTVGFSTKNANVIGPELGFGHAVADYLSDQVVLVKFSWGGITLRSGFRPPSAVAKRGGSVGDHYNLMVSAFRDALAATAVEFPGREIELAGFGWHQGWSDRQTDDGVNEYEANMADFIADVRAEFGVPGLPFVIGTTSMGGDERFVEPPVDAKGALVVGLVNAQEAMEPRENVSVVNTRFAWRDVSVSPYGEGFHWNRNAESYYLVGDSMGDAMVALLSAPPESDVTLPEPATMSFVTPPTVIHSATVIMSAVTATDTNGVQYYFTNTTITDGSHDSDWQGSPDYTDTGLNPSTTYTYTVQARDQAVLNNTNVVSAGVSVTTPAIDTTAPTPSPMTFTSVAATHSAITMTATTVTDDNYDVEYYFEDTSGNPGGTDSGWQVSPTYTDAFLNAATTYSYRVKARDKAATPNETGFSEIRPETTSAAAAGVINWTAAQDITAPTDIVTTGTLVASRTGDDKGGTITVNGVPFEQGLILTAGANNATYPESVTDPGLQALLRNISYNGNSFTLTGLTPGAEYLLQVLLCDFRAAVPGRLTTFDDGNGNTVTLGSHPASGNAGQFTIGTFTAAGTSHTIGTSGAKHVSGYQLRLTSELAPDTTPPTPATMSFDSVPEALSDSSITMTAATATDVSGVEYSFTETSGNTGGTDSGWQDSPTYTDTGLSPSTTYTYTVQARDKSSDQNTNIVSAPASATTAAPDITPPTPATMSFDSGPEALSDSSITMTAATATDVSEVEYLFTNTTLSNDSGWQDSPTYTDTGLNPSTTYTYTVQARDKSSNQNTNTVSAPASATTQATPPVSGSSLTAGTSYSSSLSADVSVVAGNAGYSALLPAANVSTLAADLPVNVTFDNMIDYNFFNEGTAEAVNSYASGAAERVSDVAITDTAIASTNYADAWTTTDPGAGLAFTTDADFTSGTTLNSLNGVMTGSVDITGLTSGTLYFIYGGYNNRAIDFDLTMSDGVAANDVDLSFATPFVMDVGTKLNEGFMREVNFTNDAGYDSIDYSINFVGSGKFVGVVVAGTATVVAADTYASWASENSVTGGPEGVNGSGVPNLIVYALEDGGERGVLSGDVMTFIKRGAPYGGDITYIIETSTDLGLTDAWAPAASGVAEDASSISYPLTPGSLAKEFARLKVIQNP